MKKATEIFEKHWTKATGKPLDDATKHHMRYAIEAINEALTIASVSGKRLLDEIDELLAVLEDYIHGQHGNVITEMRGRIKAACASGAVDTGANPWGSDNRYHDRDLNEYVVDKAVSDGLYCNCTLPNRNTTGNWCGTCNKMIAGSSAGRF